MICLASVECRRVTIFTGTQTSIIFVILTISGPRTSPFSIHRNERMALSATFSVLYPWVLTRRSISFHSEASFLKLSCASDSMWNSFLSLDTRVMSTLDSHRILSTGNLTLWRWIPGTSVSGREAKEKWYSFYVPGCHGLIRVNSDITVYTVLLILDWLDSTTAYTI